MIRLFSKLFSGLVLLVLFAGAKASSAPVCRLAHTIQAGQVRRIAPLIIDSRMYQLHKFQPGRSWQENRAEIQMFASLAPAFHFVGTDNFGAFGRGFVFFTADGIEFTIPADQFEFVWPDPAIRHEKLLEYLHKVSEIVRRGQTAPELDEYFQRQKEGRQRRYWGLENSKKKDPREEYYLGPVEGTSYSRYFVKRVRATEKLIIETYDTELRGGDQDPFGPKYDHSVREHTENGLHQREKVIREVLDFVFKLYAERRGWRESFLQTLFEKAMRLADQTRTIVIREKSPGGQAGEIISTISLNRSVYGKVRFFDEKDQTWKEMQGSFGNLFREALGEGYDGDYLSPHSPHYWNKPVKKLGMEEYFGNGAFLERPSVIEEIEIPSYQRPSYLHRRGPIFGATADWDVEPSTLHPIYYSAGIIFEPKSFGVAKESELRGIGYSELLLELFQSVFHSERDQNFSLNAQRLYTYNNPAGVSLYKEMGFHLVTEAPPLHKDGVDWQILAQDPKEMRAKLQDPKFQRRRIPQEAMQAFADGILRILELQDVRP